MSAAAMNYSFTPKTRTMRIFKKSLLLYTLLITFTGFSQGSKNSSVTIEGKVISETTGQPVAHVHVYVLGGEEETLTNDKGEFSIQSWQKTPLRLTVDGYNTYQKITVVVNDPSQKQVIRLKIKSR